LRRFEKPEQYSASQFCACRRRGKHFAVPKNRSAKERDEEDENRRERQKISAIKSPKESQHFFH